MSRPFPRLLGTPADVEGHSGSESEGELDSPHRTGRERIRRGTQGVTTPPERLRPGPSKGPEGTRGVNWGQPTYGNPRPVATEVRGNRGTSTGTCEGGSAGCALRRDGTGRRHETTPKVRHRPCPGGGGQGRPVAEVVSEPTALPMVSTLLTGGTSKCLVPPRVSLQSPKKDAITTSFAVEKKVVVKYKELWVPRFTPLQT